jgi:CO/xanthine dehydrogenase FAD-binding subunit
MPPSAAVSDPRLFRPRTVEAAVAHLAPTTCILGGGTIVANQVFVRGLRSSLLDIGDIDEIQGARQAGGALRIGALYPVADLPRLAADGAAALTDAGLVFSNPRVARLATVGGNIAWSTGPGMSSSPSSSSMQPLRSPMPADARRSRRRTPAPACRHSRA